MRTHYVNYWVMIIEILEIQSLSHFSKDIIIQTSCNFYRAKDSTNYSMIIKVIGCLLYSLKASPIQSKFDSISII